MRPHKSRIERSRCHGAERRKKIQDQWSATIARLGRAHNLGVMARMLLNGESRFFSVCDVNGLDVAKRSPGTTSTLEAGQRLSSHRGLTRGTESRKAPALSSLDVRDRMLIAIIADPTAPVYSTHARRPPTRMPRGLPLLQQLQCRDSGFVQS